MYKVLENSALSISANLPPTDFPQKDRQIYERGL
jgi:hypothetical protein